MGDPLERVPPQNLEAEAAVLGCCLLDSEAVTEVVGQMREMDFYRTSNRLIFKTISEMHKDNEPVDTITVGERLRRAGTMEDVGGSEYLYSLTMSVPSAAGLPRHVRIVREKAVARNSIVALTTGLRELDDTGEPGEIVARAITRLEDVRAESAPKQKYLTIADVLLAPEAGPTTPLPIPALQDVTGGIEAEEYVLISGNAGSGKTTLCMQLLVDAAVRGERVVIWSHDISMKKALTWGWAGMEHRTISDVVNDAKSFERFAQLPIEIYPGQFTLPAILESLRAKAAEGVTWFVLDYLEKVQIPGEKLETWAMAGAVSAHLQDALRGLGVRALVIQRTNKVDLKNPRMQDVSGAGSISNDVSMILFLQKSEKERKEGERADPTKVWVLKNQHGEVPKVAKLEMVGMHHRFKDWEGE